MLVIFTPNSEFPTETQLSLSAMWHARCSCSAHALIRYARSPCNLTRCRCVKLLVPQITPILFKKEVFLQSRIPWRTGKGVPDGLLTLERTSSTSKLMNIRSIGKCAKTTFSRICVPKWWATSPLENCWSLMAAPTLFVHRPKPATSKRPNGESRNLIGHRSVCNIMLGPRYTLYSIILVFFSWNKPKLDSVIDMNGWVGLKKVSSR